MKKSKVLIIDNNIPLYESSLEEWTRYDIQTKQTNNIPTALGILSHEDFGLIVIVESKSTRKEFLDNIEMFHCLSSASLIVASNDPIDSEYRINAHNLGALDVWQMPNDIREAVAKGKAVIREYSNSVKKRK